jgi:hypothetical protein
MATHIKALTYKPKIDGVLTGKIRQTIRPITFLRVEKFNTTIHNYPKPVLEGDTILFHGWEGKPYRSPWSWRLKVKVDKMLFTKIYKEGICKPQEKHIFLNIPTHRLGFKCWDGLDELAQLDGIKDGKTMGELFNEMYTLERYFGNEMNMKATKYFQIIHWEWPPIEREEEY